MVAGKFLVRHDYSTFTSIMTPTMVLEVFQFQLFSLTSIPLDEQKIVMEYNDHIVSDNSNLAAVSEKLPLLSISAEEQESTAEETKKSKHVMRKLEKREEDNKLESQVEDKYGGYGYGYGMPLNQNSSTYDVVADTIPDLCKNPVDWFSAGLVSTGLVDENNIFEWSVTIIGPSDTLYEGEFFNAITSFPPNYPNSPPTVKFTTEIWNPNVYPEGLVCISILHPPNRSKWL
ncbi:ubiquitin-conjugating enzyme E2 E1-like [Hibiscus syriacus]|uniref:ubiquitin-conjugating enzyme E2 E1-like n=1 Tax=Hibiscus syriacus TaxID=106335 RepID=UPI001924BD89|nr:ubiquitin-conjugating enzyme E2 E1-like [Hibiscus syriacus]